MEQIAQDYGEKLIVAKIDVDENGDLSQRYGIRGIPAILIFKDGELKERVRPSEAASRIASYVD